MKTILIAARPLTREAFAPFGEIIDMPSRPPDILTEQNRYWDDVVRYDVGGVAEVAFLEVYRRPFRFHTMERHLTHTQGFIPLEGKPMLFALAPHSDRPEPDPAQVRAFYLDGKRGVMLHVGTWHHLLFPLDASSRAVLLLRQGTRLDDMNVVDLGETRDIEFEIRPPEKDSRIEAGD